MRRKSTRGNTARDVALYLSRAHSGLRNVELAREFGGMSRSNVTRICQRIDAALVNDEELARVMSLARKALLRKNRERSN